MEYHDELVDKFGISRDELEELKWKEAADDVVTTIINSGLGSQSKKDFNALDKTSKIYALNDTRISAEQAEELVIESNEATELLTDEKIIEKLAKNCDQRCKEEKIKAINAVDSAIGENDKFYKSEIEKVQTRIKHWDNAGKTINEISSFVNGVSEAVKSPETLQVQLTEGVEKAHREGLLSRNLTELMITSLNGTVNFQTSFEDLMTSARNELAVSERESIKEKGIITKAYAKTKNYLVSIKTGFKSMSKTEGLVKGTSFVSSLVSNGFKSLHVALLF
jgi:hypothetical protein